MKNTVECQYCTAGVDGKGKPCGMCNGTGRMECEPDPEDCQTCNLICDWRKGKVKQAYWSESGTKHILGTSQMAVLAWLKAHPNAKSQEVGDALYDKTSMTAAPFYAEGITTPRKQLRARWASRILQGLKKKGLVNVDDYNDPHWFVTKGNA